MRHLATLNKRTWAMIILGVDIALLAGFAIHMNTDDTTPNAATLSLPDADNNAAIAIAPKTEKLSWISDNIGPHGSLASLFSNLKLSQADLNKIMALKLSQTYLNVVHPGEQFDFQIDQHNQLQAMKANLAHGAALMITREGSGFSASLIQPKLTQTMAYAFATIHSSLSAAAHQAGLNNNLTANLEHIFGDKIDFAKDIRKGAHFAVLYPAYYQGDDLVSTGPIAAAEFANAGHTFKAIRFTYPKNHTGYYTPDGRNVKRLFLKAPLHYSRISSYFSYHRMDPILHRIHPHLGIDYAAPIGTPVHAMSDGHIAFMGKKGGYGNAMIIDYGRHYRTLYGHLHGFAHGLHTGEQVTKGQTVAYVGDTGWSTGPHLHYGLYINGIPKNPLKTQLPMGSSIPKSYLPVFHEKAQALLAQLSLRHGPTISSH